MLYLFFLTLICLASIRACREEIEFLLACCDTNHDGKIDYVAFTDRFHEPAKEIGFNLAVLLTNLSEHMPNEPRYGNFTLEYKIKERTAWI